MGYKTDTALILRFLNAHDHFRSDLRRSTPACDRSVVPLGARRFGAASRMAGLRSLALGSGMVLQSGEIALRGAIEGAVYGGGRARPLNRGAVNAWPRREGRIVPTSSAGSGCVF